MLSVGDAVETIDDAIKGQVIAINGTSITIEANDGFHFQFDVKELIKIDAETKVNLASFSNQQISEIKREKEGSTRQKTKVGKSKDRNKPVFVVDLHIHQLKDSVKRDA